MRRSRPRPSVVLAGRSVRRVGLGCMGMSFAYQDDAASDDPVDVVGAAIRAGTPEQAVLIDTADVYGPFVNEEIVGAAVARHGREHVVLATKGGLVAPGGDAFVATPDGRPEHLRSALRGSLRRLGVDDVDLYQLHRRDLAVPVEESWGALADLVTEGLVQHLGASSASVDELAAMQAIHPVASVQGELSLLQRRQLAEVVPWCERHGTVFIAYGPLTRGLMTGTLGAEETFAANDVRSKIPAFSAERTTVRERQIDLVSRAARMTGATSGQVTLARLFAFSDVVMAIPGTRRVARWEENVAAADIRLAPEAMSLLDDDVFVTS